MPRRLLTFLVMVAAVAVVACNSTPAAPALTDPKEILLKSVTSLATVKTATIKGTFGGAIVAEGVGNFDLSTVKIDASIDIAAKKARLQVDAPTLMGTAVDAIVADENIYLKVVGPLAAMLSADTTGKYTKVPVGTGAVPSDATDPAKAIEELRKSLDQLPNAPVKLADENINGQDSYHVQLAFTAEDLAGMSPGTGATVGPISLDIWTRKNDLRPSRMAFSVDAGAQGTVTGTFDFTYDSGVSISAPPADQVAP